MSELYCYICKIHLGWTTCSRWLPQCYCDECIENESIENDSALGRRIDEGAF